MNYVILTWDNIYDMDIIRNADYSPMVFKTIKDAEEWVEDNDDKVCCYTKCINLED